MIVACEWVPMLDFWMAGRLVVGQGVLVRGFFAFFRNEVTNFCNEVTTWGYFGVTPDNFVMK